MNNIIFPAEWYNQSGVQITWPHVNTDWNPILEEIIQCYVNISKEIIKREKLIIVCQKKDNILSHFSLQEQSNIILVNINSNDTWNRDYSYISLFINNIPTVCDFTFNAWGLKFPSNYDNQINKIFFESNILSKNVRYKNNLDFVLEGGSIESDGNGTIMTTSKCLLSLNRNQHLSKTDIENQLKMRLGAKRILWLEHGFLSGDDTDSHIDTLARFCSDNTIAYIKCEDKNDEHYEELSKMEKEIKSFLTIHNQPYNLIELPMAEPNFWNENKLPATYANFLIINQAVLVPTYNSPKDSIAISKLKKAFPDREIIGINCNPIIKGNGSLHCITMQIPEYFL